MPKSTIITIFFFLLSLSETTFSAEFEIVNDGNVIVLQGVIEEGDFEKVLDTILVGGLHADTVFLATSGGNATEALKIGRLIRDLGYTTQAPILAGDTPLCHPSLGVSPQNCVCYSACSLIYVAGVERQGDYLGVHRVFLNYADSRNLGLADSIELSSRMRQQSAAYLLDMDAPISLIEKINSSSSDQLEILEETYIRDNLTGYIPAYEEWLIARCGSRKATVDHRGTTDWDEYLRISACYDNELTKESERSFYSVIQRAISEANRSFISPGSLLAYVSNLPSFELLDVIGLDAIDALKKLSLFGVSSFRPLSGDDVLYQGYLFNNSIEVGFDRDGKVFLIRLLFLDERYSDQRAYTGYFLSDLDSGSSPNDFSNKFGHSDDTRCLPSGDCGVGVTTSDYVILAIFDSEEKLKSMRAVGLN